jgi:hypothetical protein
VTILDDLMAGFDKPAFDGRRLRGI